MHVRVGVPKISNVTFPKYYVSDIVKMDIDGYGYGCTDGPNICTPVCAEEWLAPISHQRHFPVTPPTFCPTRAETPSEDPQFCASLHYYPRLKVKRHSGENLNTVEHETLHSACVQFIKDKRPRAGYHKARAETCSVEEKEIGKVREYENNQQGTFYVLLQHFCYTPQFCTEFH